MFNFLSNPCFCYKSDTFARVKEEVRTMFLPKN